MVNKWFFLTFGVISLVLFTNADQVVGQEQALKNKLTRIDEKIESGSLSEGATGLWQILRHQVSQKYLFLENARDCHDAVAVDPKIHDGIYEFRDPEVPLQYKAYGCSFGNNVSQVAAYPASQSHCTDGNCGFSGITTTEMVCGSSDLNKDKLCYAPLPISVKVVDQLSSKGCEKDVTYGKNFFGIWTKKGCKARFEVKALGNGGFVNAVNLDPFFGEDPEDYPYCPKKIPVWSLQNSKCKVGSPRALQIKKARESISENSKLYGGLRKNSEDLDQLKADEHRLSKLVWKQSQKLIHLYRYRSCGELFSDQQGLLNMKGFSAGVSPYDKKAMTGQYYFYSSHQKQEERTVKGTPTFCDGSLLVRKDSSNILEGWQYQPNAANRSLFGLGLNNTPKRLNFYKGNFVYYDGSANYLQKTSIFTPPLSVATVRLHDNGDDQTLIKAGYFVPTQCIAKKDVEYRDSGPYSYVDETKFGDVVYEAVGIRFCFKSGENFKYDKRHLVHGYRYKKFGLKGQSNSIEEVSMSQFKLVALGSKPPESFKFSGGLVSKSAYTTHCISKGRAEQNKKRNDRPVLLKDDLGGIRGRVYHWEGKYYCYGVNEEKAFNEDGLVYAYLNKEGGSKIKKFAATIDLNPEALSPKIKIGLAEPIVSEDSFELRGWSCEVGRLESIKINIKAGDKIVKTLVAKDKSGGPVAQQCQTDGRNYRYKVVFDRNEINQYAGKNLNIEGISLDTKSPIGSNKNGMYQWPSNQEESSGNCTGFLGFFMCN